MCTTWHVEFILRKVLQIFSNNIFTDLDFLKVYLSINIKTFEKSQNNSCIEIDLYCFALLAHTMIDLN